MINKQNYNKSWTNIAFINQTLFAIKKINIKFF